MTCHFETRLPLSTHQSAVLCSEFPVVDSGKARDPCHCAMIHMKVACLMFKCHQNLSGGESFQSSVGCSNARVEVSKVTKKSGNAKPLSKECRCSKHVQPHDHHNNKGITKTRRLVCFLQFFPSQSSTWRWF